MNTEKYLPIGTVCLLKNAKKRVMVTGFAAKGKETGDKMFDYIGCLYPEGVISSDKNLLFNHDQIDKIFYMGYVDDEQKELMNKLKSYLDKTADIDNIAMSIPLNNIPGQNNNLQQIKQSSNIQMQSEKQNTNPIGQSQIVFDPKRDEIFNSVPNQD